jgi:hypothetical protein
MNQRLPNNILHATCPSYFIMHYLITATIPDNDTGCSMHTSLNLRFCIPYIRHFGKMHRLLALTTKYKLTWARNLRSSANTLLENYGQNGQLLRYFSDAVSINILSVSARGLCVPQNTRKEAKVNNTLTGEGHGIISASKVKPGVLIAVPC